MKKQNILMLAWGAPAQLAGFPTGSVVARQLAQEEHEVSLLLPQAHQHFYPKSAAETILDKVPQPAPKSEIYPFAQAPYIRSYVPLYGAPVANYKAVPLREQHPGETMAAGQLNQIQASTENIGTTEFYTSFQAMSLQQQVIAYARHASRMAFQIPFNIIYAADWRTFLAATELKIQSGKNLILAVPSLGAGYPANEDKGWIYEVEKQTLERADAIIAFNAPVATKLETAYNLSSHQIQRKACTNRKTASAVVYLAKAASDNSLSGGVTGMAEFICTILKNETGRTQGNDQTLPLRSRTILPKLKNTASKKLLTVR